MIGRRVAVVVPVFNNLRRTRRFLRSFARVRHRPYTIIVVDDGSTDGTAATLARHYPSVVVLPGTGELWWSGATNLGVEHALANGFDYILTINNDTLVDPDFLTRLIATAEGNPRTIVGCRIDYLDAPGAVWAAGVGVRWRAWRGWEIHDQGATVDDVRSRRPNPFPVDALTGCGTLIPADCFPEVGRYDARWCPQYHGDTEFTLRARQHGYRCLVQLDAVVWNDAENTGKIFNLRDFVFSKRSAYYWPAMWAMHARYCPWFHMPGSLARMYSRYFFRRRQLVARQMDETGADRRAA